MPAGLFLQTTIYADSDEIEVEATVNGQLFAYATLKDGGWKLVEPLDVRWYSRRITIHQIKSAIRDIYNERHGTPEELCI